MTEGMVIQMDMPLVFMKQLKDTVERVLHVPGNYSGGVLEMAVVLDCNLPKDRVERLLPAMLRALKMHSPVFRNVRLNVITWQSDGEISNRVSPMSMVLMSSFYEDYVQEKKEKTFEPLVEYLKMYQARAKLVILLTDGTYRVEKKELSEHFMQPFLDKKMMQVLLPEDGESEIRYRNTFLN